MNEIRKLVHLMAKLDAQYSKNPKATVSRARILKKALATNKRLNFITGRDFGNA